MSFYNLTIRADRDRLRAEHNAELEAVKQGRWPRDINDIMRWTRPVGDRAAYAARMCLAEIKYLDDMDSRTSKRDLDVPFLADLPD